MKPDIRWQLLLAVVCLGLVISVLGVEYQSTGLCSEVVSSGGGRLSEGIVGLPEYINPLLSDQNQIDQRLVDLIFDGLTRYDESGLLIPSIAESWSVSDDGLVYTFQLNETARWHDGRPVTADDVIFTYSLLKQDDFPASEKMKSIWQTVSIEVLDEYEIQFEIVEPYGPFLEATTTGLLPFHILGDLRPEEVAAHSYNFAPIGTGPFLINPGRDWRKSGMLNMSPNPHYWREGVSLDGLDIRFYSDSVDLASAYSSGEIQAVSSIQADDMTSIGALPGIRIFTSRAPRLTQLIFNLRDDGDRAVKNSEIRRAFAHGIDRVRLINEALNGMGLPLEGPFLPSNWAYNQGSMTEYGFDAALASTLLSAAGWDWDPGSEFRSSSDQELEIRLLFADEDLYRALARNIADQWANIGVKTTLLAVRPEDLSIRLREGAFDGALVEIEPTGDPDLYDFWSQEAIVRGLRRLE